MKVRVKSGMWLLPLVLLTGCFHFHKAVQPPAQATAPTVDTPPPANPAPATVELAPTETAASTKKTSTDYIPPPKRQAPAAKPSVHHKKRVVVKEVQQASTDSPGVSAVGQLSSGDPSDLRGQTVDSLSATEHSLNGINRKLSDQEQKTAAQIREFLKQAKAALTSGDVDGAHTLAVKAKVLLGELSQ